MRPSLRRVSSRDGASSCSASTSCTRNELASSSLPRSRWRSHRARGCQRCFQVPLAGLRIPHEERNAELPDLAREDLATDWRRALQTRCRAAARPMRPSARVDEPSRAPASSPGALVSMQRWGGGWGLAWRGVRHTSFTRTPSAWCAGARIRKRARAVGRAHRRPRAREGTVRVFFDNNHVKGAAFHNAEAFWASSRSARGPSSAPSRRSDDALGIHARVRRRGQASKAQGTPPARAFMRRGCRVLARGRRGCCGTCVTPSWCTTDPSPVGRRCMLGPVGFGGRAWWIDTRRWCNLRPFPSRTRGRLGA